MKSKSKTISWFEAWKSQKDCAKCFQTNGKDKFYQFQPNNYQIYCQNRELFRWKLKGFPSGVNAKNSTVGIPMLANIYALEKCFGIYSPENPLSLVHLLPIELKRGHNKFVFVLNFSENRQFVYCDKMSHLMKISATPVIKTR